MGVLHIHVMLEVQDPVVSSIVSLPLPTSPLPPPQSALSSWQSTRAMPVSAKLVPAVDWHWSLQTWFIPTTFATPTASYVLLESFSSLCFVRHFGENCHLRNKPTLEVSFGSDPFCAFIWNSWRSKWVFSDQWLDLSKEAGFFLNGFSLYSSNCWIREGNCIA